MPACNFSASVANDQALSVARAELAVEQCASSGFDTLHRPRYISHHSLNSVARGNRWL